MRDGDGGGWRPSPALDPAWIAAHSGVFDVLHVHFGFEGRTPGQLRELVAAVRRAGRGLVFTVHDLENPHLAAQDGYARTAAGCAEPTSWTLRTPSPGTTDPTSAAGQRTTRPDGPGTSRL